MLPMDDFALRVRSHPWGLEPHDEWHKPEDILGTLIAAWHGEADSYDQLMSTLANNHAGEWYPGLVSAMPFMAEILARGATAGARAVLYLLTDFVYSFHVFQPDPVGARRLELDFHDCLRQIQRTLVGDTALAQSDLEAAAGLVEVIDERLRDTDAGQA